MSQIQLAGPINRDLCKNFHKCNGASPIPPWNLALCRVDWMNPQNSVQGEEKGDGSTGQAQMLEQIKCVLQHNVEFLP